MEKLLPLEVAACRTEVYDDARRRGKRNRPAVADRR
jgi:hypothetical protein